MMRRWRWLDRLMRRRRTRRLVQRAFVFTNGDLAIVVLGALGLLVLMALGLEP